MSSTSFPFPRGSGSRIPKNSKMNDDTKATGLLGPVIMLAGGGTGGHISPGLAIAERIRVLDPTARTIFACSARPIDASMLSESGAEFSAIRAEPFSMNPRRLIRFLVGLRRARKDAAALIRKCRPSWVVSLGGFVTPPVVAAARNAGVPVLLVNLDATLDEPIEWSHDLQRARCRRSRCQTFQTLLVRSSGCQFAELQLLQHHKNFVVRS